MAFERDERLDLLTNSLACFYTSMKTAEELRDRMGSVVLAEAGVEFAATVCCEPGTYLALMPRFEEAIAIAKKVGFRDGYDPRGGEEVTFTRGNPLRIARVSGRLSTRGAELVELSTALSEGGNITLLQLPNIRTMGDYSLVPMVSEQDI